MNEMILHDDRDLIIAGLRGQISTLQADLAIERSKNSQTDQGLRIVREMLSPLYKGLQQVFGEMDEMGVDVTPTPSHGTPTVDARKAAVWESWKQKFPGIPAKCIDALLLHGALSQDQLRIHAQCARGSIPGVVSQLHKAGLITKSNGKVLLKEV